jgi:hypothetical protein
MRRLWHEIPEIGKITKVAIFAGKVYPPPNPAGFRRH